ncbi:MAG: nitrite/sulfite reductase [Acidobacteria bacterium]|nr:nitrite/sulfite reductase [Acidobacteriota bacterium]
MLKLELKTKHELLNEAELNKLNQGLAGTLASEFRAETTDIAWEAEQIAKSHGIYLEFNRAKSGKEKDWFYMIRIGIPGGQPLSPQQWALLDDLAERYAVNPQGQASLRLTTRQAVQFHWVSKQGVLEIVKRTAESGLFSLNACGDNVRNVLACPHSHHQTHFNGHDWARKMAHFFQLPLEPFFQVWAIDPNPDAEPPSEHFAYGPGLLNRKFKIAVGSILKDETGQWIQDNCTELRTNDLGFSPILSGDEVTHFQVYVGGGQGEKNGKPTASILAEPLAKIQLDQLLPVAEAIVATHQEWGDRHNRHWARLKYVIKQQGITWFREQVQSRLDFPMADPDPQHDVGSRHLHHGWFQQADNGLWSYGLFVENGRLTDTSPHGKLKSLVRTLSETYQSDLILTANQDLLFTNIPEASKAAFERDLNLLGRQPELHFSSLRLQSGACVGRDTCRLAYTDSEQFEPELIETLEARGLGDLNTSIGITGCERQCFRPATKAIGLIGSGLNRYLFKFFGTEDARNQGVPLRHDGRTYLNSVPRERVADVIEVLALWYREESRPETSFGYFLRDQGVYSILNQLENHPKTADLLLKTIPTGGLIL